MRQQYESEDDRRNEREVIDELLLKWNCDHFHKNPKAYGIDFSMLRNGRVCAFVEIKCRPTLPFDYGDGYYIAVQKVISAYMLTLVTGLPCLLVIRPKDKCLYWTDFAHDIPTLGAPRIIIHGRDDRGDPDDYEPCAVYPWSEFTPIKRVYREHAA